MAAGKGLVVEEIPSEEELDQIIEELDSTDFMDIKSPEELYQENSRLRGSAQTRENIGMFFVSGPLGILGFPLAAVAAYQGDLLSTGLSLTVGAYGAVSIPVIRHIQDYRGDVKGRIELNEDEINRWFELPPVSDMSYLVEEAVSTEFEVPYEDWLHQNISEWCLDTSQDLAAQELEEEYDIDVEVNLGVFDHGSRRVYIREDVLNEGSYRFVLEVYSEEGDLLNTYWGITDEHGRHIVEENGGARDF